MTDYLSGQPAARQTYMAHQNNSSSLWPPKQSMRDIKEQFIN